jgi:hypothetical protein
MAPGINRKIRRRPLKKLFSAAFAMAALLAAPAMAQTWPSKPVTMIVPFAAGGPTDIVARFVSEHMSRTLGQQIVIENVAGAGGTTGITRAAGAAPDGYTIMMGHMGTHGAAPALYPGLKYDPTALIPVGIAASTPSSAMRNGYCCAVAAILPSATSCTPRQPPSMLTSTTPLARPAFCRAFHAPAPLGSFTVYTTFTSGCCWRQFSITVCAFD